jgi:hypothetical protein
LETPSSKIAFVVHSGPPSLDSPLPGQDIACPRRAFRCDAPGTAPGRRGRALGRGGARGNLVGALEERPRERGMAPTVYPTSAPRSTVGDWLAENGFGVGSYEYGWLLQNILSVDALLAGGKRSIIEGGEALRHFVGSRGSMGFVVRAWITTRRASGDMPVAALFRYAGDFGNAVMDLDRGGVPLWRLGFPDCCSATPSGGALGAVPLHGGVSLAAYPRSGRWYIVTEADERGDAVGLCDLRQERVIDCSRYPQVSLQSTSVPR